MFGRSSALLQQEMVIRSHVSTGEVSSGEVTTKYITCTSIVSMP
jgi:hypothetical protein